jgi:hypothetical protein
LGVSPLLEVLSILQQIRKTLLLSMYSVSPSSMERQMENREKKCTLCKHCECWLTEFPAVQFSETALLSPILLFEVSAAKERFQAAGGAT